MRFQSAFYRCNLRLKLYIIKAAYSCRIKKDLEISIGKGTKFNIIILILNS